MQCYRLRPILGWLHCLYPLLFGNWVDWVAVSFAVFVTVLCASTACLFELDVNGHRDYAFIPLLFFPILKSDHAKPVAEGKIEKSLFHLCECIFVVY